MAKAKEHYMVECYYPDHAAGGFRKDSLRVVAYDDTEAIREAKNGIFRKPAYFYVRAVSRKASRLIFKSPTAPDIPGMPPES